MNEVNKLLEISKQINQIIMQLRSQKVTLKSTNIKSYCFPQKPHGVPPVVHTFNGMHTDENFWNTSKETIQGSTN